MKGLVQPWYSVRGAPLCLPRMGGRVRVSIYESFETVVAMENGRAFEPM